jgi:outer membrane immunogenic protein
MKKVVIAISAVAAMSGSAVAADMAVKAAPPMAVRAMSWTGCYVGAGGGYGMFNTENKTQTDPGGFVFDQGTFGGRGYFGTAQVGCDYQFSPKWVAGAFADVDVGNLKGTESSIGFSGDVKQKYSWAAGARLGYLPWDTLLTYWSGGFTQQKTSQIDINFLFFGPAGLNSPAQTWNGWFLGSGYEYKLDWLPGLMWKTEYRFADYGSKTIPILVTATGAPTGVATNSHPYVQTIRTELVYRFNMH